MKNLIKKYSELDNEIKKDLQLLYIYNELLSISEDYENVKIKDINEKEKIMQIILKCVYCTNISIDDIITNIFEILDCQDITIDDLDKLEIDELLEILFDDDIEVTEVLEESEESETSNDGEIILEFNCRGYHCIFLKNEDKYFLIMIYGEDTEILIFDSIEEILSNSIEKFLLEKKLYGKPVKKNYI